MNKKNNKQLPYFFNNEIGVYTAHDMAVNITQRNINKDVEIIHLVLCSVGGSLEQAIFLSNVIRGSKIPVYTYGVSEVASAAIILLSSGVKGHRYILRETRLMTHSSIWYKKNLDGEHLTIPKVTKHLEKMRLENELTMDLYAKLTKLSKEQIDNEIKTDDDLIFTPEQAVEYGIADEVIDKFPFYN